MERERKNEKKQNGDSLPAPRFSFRFSLVPSLSTRQRGNDLVFCLLLLQSLREIIAALFLFLSLSLSNQSSEPLLPPTPLCGGRYPFHPLPFMFHATRPPSCSSQISSLQVHQEYDEALDAAVIARKSGLELPCGEIDSSGVEMSTQQTKWWLPSAGKQCWVSAEARSRVPQGAGGAGSAEQKRSRVEQK